MIVGSIEQVRHAGEALAVNEYAVRTLRILRLGGGKAYRPQRDTRRHQLEVRESAAQHGQLRDLLLAVGGRDIASFGLEQRGFGADFKRLGHFADL